MQIHLFSDGGSPFLANIVEACQTILAGVERPTVAYLPAASVDDTYFAPALAALRPLGKIITMAIDDDPLDQMTTVLDSASALFMPGGNTYLLSWRLHRTGMLDVLRERVRGGLPLVCASAGSVMCGLTMLTTNDMNCCASVDFNGLGFVPYNLNVHYPEVEGPVRAERMERLWEFHHYFELPIIALEDSAYVHIDDEGSRLIRGGAWRIEQGRDTPTLLNAGDTWTG